MKRSDYFKILLLTGSLVVSLVLGEIIFRFIVKVPMPIYPPIKWHYPELYQQSDLFGYSLVPSRITHYCYPLVNPRTLRVVSNSDGFRSCREFTNSDDRIKILIVGDSFVFGEGVQEGERFTNIIESLQPDWRVDNLGMTGFSPGLMLRAFETVGLKIDPQVVVLCLYTDDFRRVRPYYEGVGFKIPRYVLKKGKLSTIQYPILHFYERLYLIQAIRCVYWKYSNAIYDINKAILDRFVEVSKLNDYKFVIVFLPGRGDTPDDKKRRYWLSHYSERMGIPFLDLTDCIHKWKRNKVFIYHNPHLNPFGHLVVANAIEVFLRTKILK